MDTQMKHRATAYIMTLALILPLLASCRHKGFYDENPPVKIQVKYVWDKAPDASAKGMCIHFYNETTHQSRRFDFKGMEGGIIELPASGVWKIISYNNDTEAVLFDGENDYMTHSASTREGNVLEPVLGASAPPRGSDSTKETVTISPDMMWGISETDHRTVTVIDGNSTVITLHPHKLVATYTYEIRNVDNLSHVTNMCGSISGMSGGMTLNDESLFTQCVTLPFPAKKEGESTITGMFYTFGHHEGNPEHHRVMLYLWMDDGKKYVCGTSESSKWDVTSQVHSAPDRMNVHFIIDGLDLPTAIDDGGMSTTTDDWHSEDHDIEL